MCPVAGGLWVFECSRSLLREETIPVLPLPATKAGTCPDRLARKSRGSRLAERRKKQRRKKMERKKKEEHKEEEDGGQICSMTLSFP